MFGCRSTALKQLLQERFAACGLDGYSPLEQYSHKAKIGPWTEVYALGAMLYEMQTGKLPPDSIERYEDKDKLMFMRPYAIYATTQLAEIVQKALALKQNERYQTVEEIQQALIEVLQSESLQNQQGMGKFRQGINAIKSLKIASVWQNKK